MFSKTSFWCMAAMAVVLSLHLCDASQDANGEVLTKLVNGLSGTFYLKRNLLDVNTSEVQSSQIPTEIFGVPVTVEAFQKEEPDSQLLYTDHKILTTEGDTKHKESFIHVFQWEESKIAMTQYAANNQKLAQDMALWARSDISHFKTLDIEELKMNQVCRVFWSQSDLDSKRFTGESLSPCQDTDGKVYQYGLSLRVGQGFNVSVFMQTEDTSNWNVVAMSQYTLSDKV